jgi:hypothetical protein
MRQLNGGCGSSGGMGGMYSRACSSTVSSTDCYKELAKRTHLLSSVPSTQQQVHTSVVMVAHTPTHPILPHIHSHTHSHSLQTRIHTHTLHSSQEDPHEFLELFLLNELKQVWCAVYHTPYTIHHTDTPYSILHTPYTIHHTILIHSYSILIHHTHSHAVHTLTPCTLLQQTSSARHQRAVGKAALRRQEAVLQREEEEVARRLLQLSYWGDDEQV